MLTALGLPPGVAQTALRFTFEADTSAADLDRAADELASAVSGRLSV